MGSHPTLDHPNPTRELEGISAHPALQQRTDAQPTTRDLEQAFDRLNPDYGVPADPYNPHGHHALRDRETALSLGTRVAVASSRENDPNPVLWLAGQDYRVADAAHTARLELGRSRHGHQAVREREAALALGVRVAVHDSRQNDRNPVIWQPGQDYRMADALQAARAQSTRTRWGPERVGPER